MLREDEGRGYGVEEGRSKYRGAAGRADDIPTKNQTRGELTRRFGRAGLFFLDTFQETQGEDARGRRLHR